MYTLSIQIENSSLPYTVTPGVASVYVNQSSRFHKPLDNGELNFGRNCLTPLVNIFSLSSFVSGLVEGRDDLPTLFSSIGDTFVGRGCKILGSMLFLL